MARHILSVEEKLKGIRRGIRTLEKKPGGPTWLIPSMKKYARKLAEQLRRGDAPTAS
jgi:hypothetical protein